MTAAAVWIVAGLLGAALEMLAPGVFLLWIGLAAVLTGVAAELLSLDWHGQLAAFVVLTAALIGLAAMRLRRRRVQGDLVNAPNAGLIGMQCHALLFEAGEGRVSLRDGTWQARTTDRSAPAPGTVLEVVGLDGTTLLVGLPLSASPR